MRAAFTLLEVLIAIAVTTLLIALMGVLWSSTYRIVERSRTVLAMDIRTRQIVDRTMDSLASRSGILPMAAQNDVTSRRWFYRLRMYMARSHTDLTQGSVTATDTVGRGSVNLTPAGDVVEKRWVRVRDEQGWTAWRTPPATEPDLDPYAPGERIRTLVVGKGAHRWGVGEISVWHGTIGRNERGERFRTGAAIAAGTNPWRYDPMVSLSESAIDFNSNGGNSIAAGIDGMSRRWSRSTATAIKAIGGDSELRGPFRGVTVLPFLMSDGSGGSVPVPWLGTTHLMRVVNGPAYHNDPWLSGRPAPITTGSYDNGGDPAAHVEPLWYPEGMPVLATNALDPATGQPRPAYGSRIADGTVIWRSEAPHLYWFQTNGDQLSRTTGKLIDLTATVLEGDGRIMPSELLTASSIGLMGAAGNNNQTMSHYAGNLHTLLKDSVYAANISAFTVATGKTNGPQVSGAAGRFGSLTNHSWWDRAGGGADSRKTEFWWGGMRWMASAGFMGNQPTANEPPGHPAWVSVTIGLVGGFQAVDQTAVERRWTVVTSLR